VRGDDSSRRQFVTRLGQWSALVGAEIVFGRFLPPGLVPVALAADASAIEGKHPDLLLLNDRPLNAETPAHLLDDPVTPARHLFVRNNGLPPAQVDAGQWTLEIDGEAVINPRSYTLAQLKQRFEAVSLQLTLECGGNGRAEFNPPARGNQWSGGAVGCPRWTGVRLADVLNDCGVDTRAVYIGYHGADTHISGDPNKAPISRGVPIAKALEPESLLAWAMNDAPLPALHGFPLRLVFGGWPASTSGKWLQRISVRDRVHDGAKMGGFSYRMPCDPVAPGAEVVPGDMCIIEAMPVKSLLTHPQSATVHPRKQALKVRGHAWAGDSEVARVDLSIDFGQTWERAALSAPVNRLAWQHFSGSCRFPRPGYYEIWARASDDRGVSQPMVLPGWNPRGYLNNACHRIAVKVV
jgi:sulfite oxidase